MCVQAHLSMILSCKRASDINLAITRSHAFKGLNIKHKNEHSRVRVINDSPRALTKMPFIPVHKLVLYSKLRFRPAYRKYTAMILHLPDAVSPMLRRAQTSSHVNPDKGHCLRTNESKIANESTWRNAEAGCSIVEESRTKCFCDSHSQKWPPFPCTRSRTCSDGSTSCRGALRFIRRWF